MNRVFLISILSIITIFFSCNDEITTSDDVLNVNPLNGSQSLNISSGSTWKAESSDSWCTLSDSTGKRNKSLELRYDDNATGAARTAKISILTGKQSKCVLVNQSGGKILLNENFNDNSKSWISVNDSITENINNGFFDIKNLSKTYSFFVGTKELIPNYLNNYLITTNYHVISGTGPFGLTFGNHDSNNFYRILVFPKGSFTISKKLNGIYTTILNISTSLVKSENSISLVKNSNNCNIYINGSKAGTFDFSTPFGPFIGFYSYPQTEVYVDFLKVNQF